MRRCSSREERSERVVGVAVEAVDQANDLREVGALHMAGGLGGESLKGGGVGIAYRLSPRR